MFRHSVLGSKCTNSRARALMRKCKLLFQQIEHKMNIDSRAEAKWRSISCCQLQADTFAAVDLCRRRAQSPSAILRLTLA